MIRNLLATTAIAALLSGGAYAADDAEEADTTMNDNAMIFSNETDAQMESQDGYFEAMPGQILASSLIGEWVYASDADDAERVGEINDVLLSSSGAAEAVVIGVGGFLGIGEKDVAIDFERLSWVRRDDGQRWLTASLTKEELEAAPAFERRDILTEEEKAAREQDMSAVPEATTDQSGYGTGEDQAMTSEQTDQDSEQQDTASAEQPAEEGGMNDEQTAAAESETTDETTASINDNMVAVEADNLSAEKLLGARVYGTDNEDIGEVSDVLVTAEGRLDAYVIDVGGFLGIGEKPVAVDGKNIRVMRDDDDSLYVYTDFTKDQLENQPEYSEEAFQTDRESVVLD